MAGVLALRGTRVLRVALALMRRTLVAPVAVRRRMMLSARLTLRCLAAAWGAVAAGAFCGVLATLTTMWPVTVAVAGIGAGIAARFATGFATGMLAAAGRA